MTDNNKDAIVERLKNLTRPELQGMLVDSAKKLGAAQKQIQQKDKLIADFTSTRERAKREADVIIAEAQEQARKMRTEAARSQAAAEAKIEEAETEVARKLANANAEADSIVEARLNQAKVEIRQLEERRDATKRSAIALNRNIAEQYDTLIEDVEKQISRFRDMKEKLVTSALEIEAEDFKKFDVADYVTTVAPAKEEKPEPSHAKASVETTVKPILDVDTDDIQLEDDEIGALAELLEDNFDEPDEDESGIVMESDDTLVTDDDLAFLNSDFDFDMDFGNDDEAEGVDEDDIFADGKMKSFTDSFMVVKPTDDDDDLGELDIDSILDDDDDFFSEPEEEPARLNIPPRRSRRSGGASKSTWL